MLLRILHEFIFVIEKISIRNRLISYLSFIAFVILYNSLYLHQGFAAQMDEGYLFSLGKRITDGQIPYTDFYFLRTPLSIYLQALFLTLSGDFHTIYIARIIYVVQLTLLTLCISDIYKKSVTSLELLFLLIVSYTISTLLLQFQWYSYDGLFFAGLSLFLLNRKKFYLTGLAIFLAAMSKQNYLLLLPAILLVVFILKDRVYPEIKSRYSIPLKILAGFILPAIIMSLYFLYIGNFTEFFIQSFLLPKTISETTLLFALIQNNPAAITESAITIITLVLLFLLRKQKVVSIIIASALILYVTIQLNSDVTSHIFNILYINYTIAILFLFHEIKNKKNHNTPLLLFLLLVISIQFISGLNYSGVLFAYMGAGLAIPFIYIIFKNLIPHKPIAIFLFLSIGILGFVHKTNYTYQENERDLLTEKFSSSKLSHLTSTKERIDKIDKITALIDQYSKPDDFIFCFPNFSSMYYITDRRNPTKIEWYYKLEYNDEMLEESVEDLKQNPPKLILINLNYTPEIMIEHVTNNYRLIDIIDYVCFYLPNKEAILDN